MTASLKEDVIALVKSAITGQKEPLSKSFDINEILKIAKIHQIYGLIYYGALNCGVNSDDPAMLEMFMQVCKSIAISEKQMYEINRVCSTFKQESIDFMTLKGTVLKSMYPKSEMRIMGDADILIKTEQYDKIMPIMTDLGFIDKTESDHELIWTKPELFLELHKRLIPSYNKDYYSYFGDGWQLAKIQDGSCFSMTDEDQMIYLFTHFSKHYRDGGIGIRHMVDLYVYRNAKTNLDEKYMETAFKKLCLYDFYINVIKTLDVWFADGEHNEKSDLITDVIFNSGVYGTHEKNVLATTLKASGDSKSIKNAKFKRIIQMTFPELKFMKLHYGFLGKYPFLLPITWIMRIFTVVFFKRQRLNRFNNDMKSISSEHINDYQNALNFVGLDFNFKE